MKTLVVNQKNIGTSLPILGFVLLASLLLATVPTLANEFEVGSQFSIISHVVPDTDDDSSSVTSVVVPPLGEIGSLFASPYITWFPSKQFAIRPEFSVGVLRRSYSYTFFGETGDFNATTNILYLGGRFEFYLSRYDVSNPYVLVGGSMTTAFSDDDSDSAIQLSVGAGYQWQIRDNYALRAEGQYLRTLAEDENVNGFRFVMGLGFRFGKNTDQQ